MKLTNSQAYAIPGSMIPVDEIGDIVSSYYEIPRDKIFSKSRFKEFVAPRHLAFLVARKFHTLYSIAEATGNNHTSVLHGSQTAINRIISEPKAFEDYTIICEELKIKPTRWALYKDERWIAPDVLGDVYTTIVRDKAKRFFNPQNALDYRKKHNLFAWEIKPIDKIYENASVKPWMP